MSIQSIMAIGPVIPVVIIENIDDAIPLADALIEGGIGTIEITLRSAVALNAIALISQERPDLTIGAGTVRFLIHFRCEQFRKLELILLSRPVLIRPCSNQRGMAERFFCLVLPPRLK